MKKDASGFKVPDMAERIVMPSSSPMRGWEAFGVATMLDAVEPPSVRELPGSEDWPAGSCTAGSLGSGSRRTPTTPKAHTSTCGAPTGTRSRRAGTGSLT